MAKKDKPAEAKPAETMVTTGCQHPRAHVARAGVMRCPDCRARWADASAKDPQPAPLPPGAVERLTAQVDEARRYLARAERHRDELAFRRWTRELAGRQRRLDNAKSQ